MPGSGKSAVGRIIARQLGWEFVDTDRCIEETFGVTLQEVVEQVGRERFGEIEEKAVLALAPDEETVISTGGSVVYSEAAMEHLAAISTVIFLDLPIGAIRGHIAQEAPRGIVGMSEGGLEELYERRFPLYRKHADVVVLLESCTVEEAAAKVLSQLREKGLNPRHR